MFSINLKEFGVQLQNLGFQIMNIGLQLQNMMNNFEIPLQNIGQQISNVSMQIFNIGMQISNPNMPIFNNNPFQNNNIFNNNIYKNFEEINISIEFDVNTGEKYIINCKDNITVEELLKRFLQRANYENKKDSLLFLFNAQKIDPNEKKSIKNYRLYPNSIITVMLI